MKSQAIRSHIVLFRKPPSNPVRFKYLVVYNILSYFPSLSVAFVDQQAMMEKSSQKCGKECETQYVYFHSQRQNILKTKIFTHSPFNLLSFTFGAVRMNCHFTKLNIYLRIWGEIQMIKIVKHPNLHINEKCFFQIEFNIHWDLEDIWIMYFIRIRNDNSFYAKQLVICSSCWCVYISHTCMGRTACARYDLTVYARA